MLRSGPKTIVEAHKSFRTVTLPVPAAAWGPGQRLQQGRKTKGIYLDLVIDNMVAFILPLVILFFKGDLSLFR